MSLTKVSYSMINGAPANILDYGATTSSSDNTAAIQAALDANDAVYIPSGTFITKLLQPNRAKVIVYGPGALQLKQGEFSEIMLLGSSVTYAEISSVEFIGNKANTTATDPTLRKRLLNAESPDAFAVVRNCVFHGSNYGGFSIDGKFVTLERNYVYDCGYTAGVGDGISVVSYNPERVVIQNNIVLDAADYGIAVDAVNAVVQNNYVKGALSAGIGSLARGATGTYGNLGVNMKFIGNTVIDCVNPMEFFCSPGENTSGFIGLEVSENYISGGTSTNPALFITRNSGGYNPAGSYIYIENNTILIAGHIDQAIGVTGQGALWETTNFVIDGNVMDSYKGMTIASARDFIVTNNIMRTTSGLRGITVDKCKQFIISDNIIDGYQAAILSTNSSGTIQNNSYFNISSDALRLWGGQYTVNEIFKSIPNRTVWVSVTDDSAVFQDNVELRGYLSFQDCGASGSPLWVSDPTTLGTIYIALESLFNYPDVNATITDCPNFVTPTNTAVRFEAKVAEGCKLTANPVASTLLISSGSPTSGYWRAGTKVTYTEPVSGGYIGSVCTAAGTSGTWKTFGLIS